MPGKSCYIYVLEHWTKSLDHGNPVDMVYFDFRKAFDFVPYTWLMLKLQTYDIRGNLLNWIEDCLVDCQQKVIVG